MNRTWIIFFLMVLYPHSWLRKLPLQWCMQESQVAVVIIAVKSPQNLPLHDPNCVGWDYDRVQAGCVQEQVSVCG